MVVKGGVLDIYIKVGLLLIFCVDGLFFFLWDVLCFLLEDIGCMVVVIMSKVQRDMFQQVFDLDMLYGVLGVGCFCVNVFQQCGLIGMVFCVIFFKVKSVDELFLLFVVKIFVEECCGLLFVMGVMGFGKFIMFVSMIDYINFMCILYIVIVEDLIEFLICDKCLIIN